MQEIMLRMKKSGKIKIRKEIQKALLHLAKQNCLLETFIRNLILMTQVSLYLLPLIDTFYLWVVTKHLP